MSVEQLLFIIDDRDLCDIYEEFLNKNMAWENLGFYKAVDKFKKAEQKDRKRIADEIFESFIKVDANHELGDIDLYSRTMIQEKLDDPSLDMFDHLIDTAVETLVNATISDFLNDSSYENYINNQFSNSQTSGETGWYATIRSAFSCFCMH